MEIRFSREEDEQRSAWIAVAFEECLALEGMGGVMMSVRMSVFSG